MSGGNGAAERSVGGSQRDGRVEVLLGSDSTRAAAVALGSSTVTIEKSMSASSWYCFRGYLPSHVGTRGK